MLLTSSLMTDLSKIILGIRIIPLNVCLSVKLLVAPLDLPLERVRFPLREDSTPVARPVRLSTKARSGIRSVEVSAIVLCLSGIALKALRFGCGIGSLAWTDDFRGASPAPVPGEIGGELVVGVPVLFQMVDTILVLQGSTGSVSVSFGVSWFVIECFDDMNPGPPGSPTPTPTWLSGT